jgi:hypothetical protein
MNACHSWKLCCSPLKIFVELRDSQNQLSHPFRKRILPNRKSTSQKEVNNKIHTSSESLTHGRKTCQETPHRISAWSNSRIDNYNCCLKTGQLGILHQNPNLIVFRCPDHIIPSLFKMIRPQITNRFDGQLLSLFFQPLEFFSCTQLSVTTLYECSCR